MFTKTGDDGTTKLPNSRVGKDSPIVIALGDIDELNSFLGIAHSKVQWDDMKRDLERIQLDLFALGEDVATSSVKSKIGEAQVKWLEERVVAYRKETGPVRLFVVPGGSEEASLLHVARTVARRIERGVVSLSKEVEVNRWVIVYLNRLSSLLFIMAVASNKRKGVEERIYDIRKYF